jgi:hypothetical protein
MANEQERDKPERGNPPKHSVDTPRGAPDDAPNPGDPGPPVLRPDREQK